MYDVERIAGVLPELLNYPTGNEEYYIQQAREWVLWGITDHIEVWDWVCNGYNDPERVAELKDKGQTIQNIESYTQTCIREKYKDLVELRVTESMNNINIEYIDVVEKEKGIGTSIMNEICKIADRLNKSIHLKPTQEMGSEFKRLVKFYKRYGFEFVDCETMKRPQKKNGQRDNGVY